MGPRYAETHPGQWPVDAWATWTNLVFLFVVVFWVWRLRGQWRRHPWIALSLPWLAVGWIGGTIYHATRSHVAWLLMDWVPIVLLLVMAGGWLWRRLLRNTALAVGATLVPPLVAFALMHRLARDPSGITWSYAIMASGVVIPAVINACHRRPARSSLGAVLACFVVALAFRAFDAPLARIGWPHGSHYLWHVFGGLATFFTFSFLYALRESDSTTPAGEQERRAPHTAGAG